MASLAFKKAYVDPICQGVKGSTFRARRPRFAVGDVVAATCRWGEPPFAWLRITAVTEIDLLRITDRMAKLDGFDSAEECRATLRDLYGHALTSVWRIRYERVPESDRRAGSSGGSSRRRGTGRA